MLRVGNKIVSTDNRDELGRTHEPCVPTFSAWEASPGPSEGGENELAGPGM